MCTRGDDLSLRARRHNRDGILKWRGSKAAECGAATFFGKYLLPLNVRIAFYINTDILAAWG
jgi:hypothetical protein